MRPISISNHNQKSAKKLVYFLFPDPSLTSLQFLDFCRFFGLVITPITVANSRQCRYHTEIAKLTWNANSTERGHEGESSTPYSSSERSDSSLSSLSLNDSVSPVLSSSSSGDGLHTSMSSFTFSISFVFQQPWLGGKVTARRPASLGSFPAGTHSCH